MAINKEQRKVIIDVRDQLQEHAIRQDTPSMLKHSLLIQASKLTRLLEIEP